MRSSAIKDYWNKHDKINHKLEIDNIDLKGLNGIEKVQFKKGIFAICGLNGVGKSTIVSAIKSIIGIELNEKDTIRVTDNIEGVVKLKENGQDIKVKISNKDGNRLVDKKNNDYLYLEHEQAIEIINRITKENNFDELLEQYDDYYMEDNDLEELNYIVGKDYQEVHVTEIDDEDTKFPFFEVKCNNIEYDSTKMGVGEHILFYYYTMIKKVQKDGIVIIEEPESCISVMSQRKFMNYMAKKHVEKQIQLIVTTHSPFIIKNIPLDNILFIQKYGNSTTIFNGYEKHLARELGLDINKKGVIYVEDRMAKIFLETILNDNEKTILLEDYDVMCVNGESEITSRLESKCTEIDYNIIGIYDGDMKNICNNKKFKWKHLFFPGRNALEKEFRKCINGKENIFASQLHKEKREVLSALSTVQGDNYHDWFINLHKKLNLTYEGLFKALYDIWIYNDNHKKEVEGFIIELSKII